MLSTKNFFSTQQSDAVKQAIVDAERGTSGEIRVHIEKKCPTDSVQRATDVFNNLKMYNTRLRNGILFYLAIDDKKFAIVGDSGINKNVPENFWQTIKDKMQERFKQGDFTGGLCEAIDESGKQLKKYFPHTRNDSNELNDEVSFGN